MQPRPGRIRKVLDVDVPRPRDRGDARLKTLIEDVRREIVEVPVD
jgi:hypothetical protein